MRPAAVALAPATVVLGLATVVLAGATVVAWTAGGDGRVPASASAVTASGADLFVAKGCASCHDGPDSSARVETGPDLGEVAAVAGRRQPGVSGADYVRRSITSPDSFTVPGFARDGMGSMPTLGLSAAEVDALAEYLLDSG